MARVQPMFAVFLLATAAVLSTVGCAPEGRVNKALENISANRVISYYPVVSAKASPATWPYFYQPEKTLGFPEGSFSVASLGYDPTMPDAPGGSITLGLGVSGDETKAYCITDEKGEDFVVYENPFETTDPETGQKLVNTEVATVAVSADLFEWYLFPPVVDDQAHLGDPARYTHFAGVTTQNEGGDGFDLDVIIQANDLPKDFHACYVRITDGGTRYPDYGNTQSDEYLSGSDIDAVVVKHGVEVGGITP